MTYSSSLDLFLDQANKGRAHFYGETHIPHGDSDEQHAAHGTDGFDNSTVIVDPSLDSDDLDADESPASGDRLRRLELGTPRRNPRHWDGERNATNDALPHRILEHHRTGSRSVDHVMDANPVDVVRPKLDLVQDLIEQWS